MIVVDTSAIMAVVENEPEAGALHELLSDASELVIGAPTLFELRMVAFSRRGEAGRATIDSMLECYRIVVRPWGEREAELALEAFRRFGKGRHPARLNFGDCCTYATARALDTPLLFKGGDFAQTDIAPAFSPSSTGGA